MKEYIEIVEKRGVRESLFGVSRSVIAFIVQLRHNPKLLEEGARPPTIQDVAEVILKDSCFLSLEQDKALNFYSECCYAVSFLFQVYYLLLLLINGLLQCVWVQIKGLMAEMVVEGLRNFSEFGRLTASMRSMITDWLMLKLKKVHRGLGAG